MRKPNMKKMLPKNTVSSDIPKFIKIHVWKDDILNKIVTKLKKN